MEISLPFKLDVTERWKTYSQELMADDSTDSHSHNIEATEELEPPILKQEVEKAVQRLREQKAAGNDDIVTEMLKATEGAGIKILDHFCTNI
ncbi:hypothetical protein HHI36_013016 [Cryptolaemus montrouzieri]|uniref:Uncharacterized protein n=1 Tax=Cryptolaemus montrouzieri TaxID=559131 RepID=A0ABD2NGZ2_9CUCU